MGSFVAWRVGAINVMISGGRGSINWATNLPMYCSMGSAVVELSDEDIDESSSIQCKEGTEDSSSSSEEVEEEASLSLDKAPLLSLLL